jgi:hypothetical protein
LRALFFLVTGLLDRLVYLSSGLALILAFIGVKLILHWGHGLDPRVPEITTAVSLAVIAAVLTITTVASLIRSRHDPTAQAHAGAVTGGPPPAAPTQRHDQAANEIPPAKEQHDPGALARSASRPVTCKDSAIRAKSRQESDNAR